MWTPNLEKNGRAEQFPIHGENEEAGYLFNESAGRQRDLFIILLFGRKELTMAECKKYFFDKLKRLRKIGPILTENGV